MKSGVILTQPMNGPTFVARVRKFTKSSGYTLSEEDIAIFANMALDEIVLRVNEINEGYFDVENFTDLVEGQRQYTLPSWLLAYMEKLTIKFDEWEDYVEAREERVAMSDSVMSELNIQRRYTDSAPMFWLRGNSIHILTSSPIPNAVGGIHLFSKQYPGEITATTLRQSFDLSVAPFGDVPGIPRVIHGVLAMRTSIMYKENQDRAIPLSQSEQSYEYHLDKALDAIVGQNRRRSITPAMPYNDGSQY